jgi:hypothetical protein
VCSQASLSKLLLLQVVVLLLLLLLCWPWVMTIRIVDRLPGWGERASTGLESGVAAWGKLVG